MPFRPVITNEARTPESILKELENLLDKHEQARYPQSGSGDHGSAPYYHAYAGGPRETDPGLPNWKSNGSSRKLAFLTPGSPLWDLTTTCVLLANQITAPKEHNDWFRLNFNKSVFNLEIVTAEDEERYADLPPFEEMESEMGAYGTWLFRHDEEPESKTQNGISHYTIVIREKSLKKLAELCGISTTRAILYSYLHELCHMCIHLAEDPEALKSNGAKKWPLIQESWQEAEANMFASFFMSLVASETAFCYCLSSKSDISWCWS